MDEDTPQVWQSSINSYNLRVARLNVGLTTQEASRKVSTSRRVDKVDLWEKGIQHPTYRQLKRLAGYYNVNCMQLLVPEKLAVSQPPATFSSSQSNKALSYNLLRFIDILRMRQAIIRDNLIEDGASKHPLVGLGKDCKTPQELADLIKNRLEYKLSEVKNFSSCLHYLRHLCQQQYIFVFKTMTTSLDIINPPEMKGIYLNDDYAPVIALNRRDFKNSQLFTLAHELAHLFRANEKVESIAFRDFNTIKDKEEVFCNQAAAALLVPKDKVLELKIINLQTIKALAQRCRVSSLVALYRLAGLGHLDKHQLKLFTQKLNDEYEASQNNQSAKKNSDGGNYYNNMRDSNGSLFNEFIFSLYIDNRVSAVEAQNLIKMPLPEIDQDV